MRENWHLRLDPSLLEATASEPLSLEDEYSMQKSWRDDAFKCTFLIRARKNDGYDCNGRYGDLVGDVNLFLNATLPEEYLSGNKQDNATAEVSVMVAVPSARRRGVACEAVQIFLDWAANHLSIETFVVRIGKSNTASLALFEEKLGFRRVCECRVFKEVTSVLEYKTDKDWREAQVIKVGERGNLFLGFPAYIIEEDLPIERDDDI
uniref:N-acetyltransferase domain-containing protein n=1 Tax=Corethron hystrix TaxID=216773 RepID=A0A7S1B5Y4_9STRA|mmetsp:Transcript_1434/g.2985  ORF Transcript_1434/g.2985 Transcript_1434/m.2985 type:complete len:207 (+) Transcript_1434:76-696(+)